MQSYSNYTVLSLHHSRAGVHGFLLLGVEIDAPCVFCNAANAVSAPEFSECAPRQLRSVNVDPDVRTLTEYFFLYKTKNKEQQKQQQN